MSGRFQESLNSKSRLTPLLVNSFSKLGDDSLLNRTADSGYQSALSDLSTSSSSLLYCSTPVMPDCLEKRSKRLLAPRFSADRIPWSNSRLELIQENYSRIPAHPDVLSGLIGSGGALPIIRRIFTYLKAEDLLRLAQVSDEICRAICDDNPSIRKLSTYLVQIHQNGENRLTSGANTIRTRATTLRSIENLPRSATSANVAAGMAPWIVPSPLDSIDMDRVPIQLKSLLQLTKTLTERQCAAVCHRCRCLVGVRMHLRRPAECSACSTTNPSVTKANHRPVRKSKPSSTLFSSFR